MAKKFLLQGNSLSISASVDYHRDLIQKFDPKKCKWGSNPTEPMPIKGGGWWHLDEANKFLLLYSTSDEFGPVDVKDLITACPETWFSLHWSGYDVYYSKYIELSKALENKELIYKIE